MQHIPDFRGQLSALQNSSKISVHCLTVFAVYDKIILFREVFRPASVGFLPPFRCGHGGMADTLVLGTNASGVQVRVLLPAPPLSRHTCPPHV